MADLLLGMELMTVRICQEAPKNFINASVAQKAERLIRNQQVAGSIPVISSKIATYSSFRVA